MRSRRARSSPGLGDDQHPRVASDPARTWHSSFTRSSPLARWAISLVVSAISRSKSLISAIRLSSPRRYVGQLQRGELLAAGCAGQIGELGWHALAGQPRVHAGP